MKETRQHVLESACHVFAQQGFHHANIAEICDRAGANIASVNYYFRSKKDLYEEALRYSFEAAEQKRPLLIDVAEITCPEERLRRFIAAQFHRLFCSGICGCVSRLTAHEMTNPTFAHERVFKELMEPQMTYIDGIVQELLGPRARRKDVRSCALSVVSLFGFHQFSTMARQAWLGQMQRTPKKLEEMVSHTTEFALAGIAAIRHRLEKERGQKEDPVASMLS
jgi:AcrR family transcriptional regulator